MPATFPDFSVAKIQHQTGKNRLNLRRAQLATTGRAGCRAPLAGIGGGRPNRRRGKFDVDPIESSTGSPDRVSETLATAGLAILSFLAVAVIVVSARWDASESRVVDRTPLPTQQVVADPLLTGPNALAGIDSGEPE